MVQGTSSGAGKSVLVTALCRIFARAGYRVAPFKSQNMSLNAAVPVDGGEIGRAQAAQAEAAGIEPTVDMNPILLKPEADDRSQIVVRGAPLGTLGFARYRAMRETLLPIVAESLARLRLASDLVIIEGAGSPAEINFRDEIVNMPIARLADAPVLLVGDIDRGGVFAALYGTLALLPPDDRGRIAGLIVNKFRGDADLLLPGLDEIAALTGVPVLGTIPYIVERLVPSEDAFDLETTAPARGAHLIDVAVVHLPRIANFDDFEPLADEPGVRVRFVRTAAELATTDLIVLPGTKTTIADLAWLRERGLAAAIVDAARAGCPVLGVCGGYQMLGETIHDPHRVESSVATAPGLGLLPAVTTFARDKTTVRVSARVRRVPGLLGLAAGADVDAYEIHAGETDVVEAPRPFTITARRGRSAHDLDGATSEDGAVVGTYLHGLLANDRVRRAMLETLARRKRREPDPRWGASVSRTVRYDRLADIVTGALDVAKIAKLVGLTVSQTG